MRGPAGPETIISSRRRSARGSAVRRCVRVKMRPEGGKAVGDTGSPGGKGADAVGLVIAVELARCEVLVGEGACWATAVAAAGAPAEPAPPSEGTAKIRAKAVLAAGKIAPRPGRRSTVVTAADTRATNPPEGAGRSTILIRGPCARKSPKSEEAKGAHPKSRCRDGAPAHSSQHWGSVRNERKARRPG